MSALCSVAWPNGKVYFFKDDQYIQYDMTKGRADRGYPKPIQGNWPGLEPFARTGTNTVLIWPRTGKAYFFSGDQYIQYDPKKKKADRGYPKPIRGNWPGLEPFLRTSGNTVVIWPRSGKVYVFAGAQYFQYDVESSEVDPGYPKPLKGNWPGLERFAGTGVNTIVVWPRTGKAYFFSGDQYIQYDVEKGRADRGYPKPIKGNWPGLEPFLSR